MTKNKQIEDNDFDDLDYTNLDNIAYIKAMFKEHTGNDCTTAQVINMATQIMLCVVHDSKEFKHYEDRMEENINFSNISKH